MLRVVLTEALLVGAFSASPDVPSIVLDNADADGSGWSQGDLKACLEDAHKGSYHDDMASQMLFHGDRGHASGVYRFDPPKDGCYVVEEHHPGQNALCSQRLPTNARIDVDYCKGKSAYSYVDQSLRGGQWNIIGALPFFVGWEGRIKVSNNGTSSTCQQGSDCLWVADAFKVTWVSDLSNGVCVVPAEYGSEEPTTTLVTTTSEAPPATTQMISSQTVESNMNIVQQALGAAQTVVDDISATSSSSWKSTSCRAKGWLQSFLTKEDSAPEAPAEFVFDPPSDGCYLVEEFHPESGCSGALSSSVPLTIHYCKGLKAEGQIDQSRNGNRWNSIGPFQFYKGIQGKVLVSHPSTGSAAADAFRFTRVSAWCRDARQASFHYHRLAQNAAAILVDNHYSPVLAARPSTLPACNIKPLGGSLHAAAAGKAEAKFEFTPTSTGCYRVDSFHPESDNTEGCGLADHAELEVNWCLGKRTTFMAPLKGKGNQWTTVGHFKFFAGNKGNVISRRPSHTPDGKLWVADAFRFTKVSEGCDAIPEVGHMSLHITGKELDGHLPKVLETGLTSYPDMRMALREAVAEATRLPYEAVNLLSLRRGSVIADVEMRGTVLEIRTAMALIQGQASPGHASTLKQSLCSAVITNGQGQCDVSVMQAKVLPAMGGSPEEAYSNEEDSTLFVVAVIASAAAGLLALTMCFLAYRFATKKKEEQFPDVATIHVSPKKEMELSEEDLKKKIEEVDMDAEKGKPACDEVSLSGSTATPGSEVMRFDSLPEDGNPELQSLSEVGNPEELQISEV